VAACADHHPGRQQAAIAARAGSNIFQAAGVPGVNQTGRFAEGGIAPAGGKGDQPIVNIDISIGKQDQTEIFINGIKNRNTDKELKRKMNRILHYG
jgi:hypothetical protein